MVSDTRAAMEVDLLRIPGVVGVSHIHNSDGKIVIYVEDPSVVDAVPSSLNGFQVEARAIGRVKALGYFASDEFERDGAAVVGEFPDHNEVYPAPATKDDVAAMRTSKERPVLGGISCGNPEITAGTLGIVTYDGKFLSNAHVLALNMKAEFLPIGTKILQPGIYDGGTLDDVCGTLLKYIKMEFDNEAANNYADAAVAKLSVSGSAGVCKADPNYTIKDIVEPVVGNIIRKSGRTSGMNTNTVIDVEATVKVWYGERFAVLKDLILVNQPFMLGGDSGSAVDLDGKFVGLGFAGSEAIAAVCKAKHIVYPLNVNLEQGAPGGGMLPSGGNKIVLGLLGLGGVGLIMQSGKKGWK